jgi:ABC-2 type transport system ATP-binding protein
MIEVQDLVKWYGPTLAVDHLSFEIPAGQIVGFLGPNGAGKSTTLRILTGYLPPTSGRASIDQLDVLTQSQSARRRIGYLPENTPLYSEMRVEEYLHYRGKLYGMDRTLRRNRIDTLTEWCGLEQIRRRLIGQLSRGNRQRVGIAQALLHDPPLLILDEPTAGLDPNQIGHVRELIANLRGKHTILLSTHILPEVEKVADRVMIIGGGKLVADGTVDELRKNVSAGARVRVEVKAAPQAVEHAFRAVASVDKVQTESRDGWTIATVTPQTGTDAREALGAAVQHNNWQLREMRFETASLEQFFIQVTARQHEATQTEVA